MENYDSDKLGKTALHSDSVRSNTEVFEQLMQLNSVGFIRGERSPERLCERREFIIYCVAGRENVLRARKAAVLNK